MPFVKSFITDSILRINSEVNNSEVHSYTIDN